MFHGGPRMLIAGLYRKLLAASYWLVARGSHREAKTPFFRYRCYFDMVNEGTRTAILDFLSSSAWHRRSRTCMPSFCNKNTSFPILAILAFMAILAILAILAI